MGRSIARAKACAISKYRKKELKKIIKEIGFGELIPKIDKSPLFWYLMDKPYTKYAFYPEDLSIPNYIVDRIEDRFHQFNGEFVTHYPPLDKEISPADGFGVYESIRRSAMSTFNEGSPLYSHFQLYIESVGDSDNRKPIIERMLEAASGAVLVSSSLDGYVYGFDVDSAQRHLHADPNFITHCFGVIRQKAPQKKLTVRGRKRLCYELLQTQGIKIYFSQTVQLEEKEYPLYIQGHVFQRIEERLCLPEEYNYYTILRIHGMYDEAFRYNDSILIPVSDDPEKSELRIGYLVCDIAESGEMVAMTFLFISQSGTPEGDRLSERLSIDKLEKEYLEMETYDHFTQSDLGEDDTIVEICRECGLDHLFDLEGAMLGALKGNASFIKETLQLEEAVEAR